MPPAKISMTLLSFMECTVMNVLANMQQSDFIYAYD